MSHEILVGLNVVNDNQYQQYRDAIGPILKQYNGAFGYDFEVAKVLKSETKEKINRVFTLHFPNEEQQNTFFNDPQYLMAKDTFFMGAVASTTIISSYNKMD